MSHLIVGAFMVTVKPVLAAVKAIIELYRYMAALRLTAVKDRIERTADESARNLRSPSTFYRIRGPLQSKVERQAAQALQSERRATIQDDYCLIDVCTLPLAIQQAMALRSMHSWQ